MTTSAQDILSLESRAARIAATLDARPELGAIWHRVTGLVEASASLSLEDVRVSEADIIGPEIGVGVIQGEPQSVHTASAIYRQVLRPTYPKADPGVLFDRAFAAARMTSLVDVEEGGRVEYPDAHEAREWEIARNAFRDYAPQIMHFKAPIILKSLGLARLASYLAPERHPSAERMIFMAAESTLRRDLVLSDPIISQPIPGLEQRVTANWVWLPSVALSTHGFRSWSPFTASGWAELISRLDRVLGQEAGRIGKIQSWMTRLDADFIGQTRKSRRKDMAAVIKTTPVVNSDVVARKLRVTQRTARNLIDAAREMELLVEVSGRYQYRLYAVPALAEMMSERRAASRDFNLGRMPTSSRGEAAAPSRPEEEARETEFESRIDDIMAEIDSTMADLDRALEAHRLSRATDPSL